MQRSINPIARLIGALLYGQRAEDAAARKNAKKFVTSGGAAGVVLWLVIEMWGLTKASILDERASHREDLSSTVSAIKEQTQALRDLTEAIHEQTGEFQASFAILLDRVSGPVGSRSVPPARLAPPPKLPPTKVKE